MLICRQFDYTGSDPAFLEKFKLFIMTEFDMSDLCLMHYFLGIEVKQSCSKIFISQKKYVQETLRRFGMQSSNSITTLTKLGLKLEKNPIGKKIDNTFFQTTHGMFDVSNSHQV